MYASFRVVSEIAKAGLICQNAWLSSPKSRLGSMTIRGTFYTYKHYIYTDFEIDFQYLLSIQT